MPRKGSLRVAAALAVLFGALTIFEGGSVLFGAGEAREAAGSYVPFVVWFNFLAGFAYVAAGAGIWGSRSWAPRLSLGIAVATLLVFGAFGAHVLSGGAYEVRTVAAMTLRTGFWAVVAALTRT
jgi:hypothetical protein